MLAAMAEVACERGAANATVAHVVARSGVSRRTFYEIFEDREDCFMAAFDEALARAGEYVLATDDKPSERWRERIRAALTALLRFLDEEPFKGRLLIVEALSAGPQALQRRQQVLAGAVRAIDEGRCESKAGAETPPLTAEGVVGAVLAIVHSRMLASDGEPLVGLANQLMAMIVLPYAGPAAARRELARDKPAGESRAPRPARSNPLTELEMRLTYRTVRVLMAIGAQPGSSNRGVADTAGISDPGQISKLLHRLHQLGLIEKAPGGRARGEPNAWRLTAKGQQVEQEIAAQAARA